MDKKIADLFKNPCLIQDFLQSQTYIFYKDTDGRYIACNEQFAKDIGLQSSQEVVGLTDKDIASVCHWPVEVIEHLKNADQQVINSKQKSLQIATPEINFVNGRKYLLINRIPYFKQGSNEIEGVLSIATDITREKAHEDKTINLGERDKNILANFVHELTGQKENKQKPVVEQIENIRSYFNNIIALMPGHVYWKDKSGKYLGCNNNLLNAIGLSSREEIIGLTDFDLAKKLKWDEDVAKSFIRDDQQVIETGIPKFDIESPPVRRSDGVIQYLLANNVPLRDKDGEVIGVLGIAIDITDRKNLEEDLIKAKEKAEEASQLKSQFIQNMEHDLRTPCSGIAAMTEILEKQERNKEKKETLSHVAKASARLMDILNGILAFDQAVSGTLPIVDKKFSIEKVVDDIFAIEKPSVISKKLKLIVNYDDDIPETIIGDEHRIARILLNVIGNAIKFTPQGSVTVSVKLPKIIDNQHAVLQVIVEDTGIGIPRDKLKHIYEKFVRVIPANKGQYAGAGLGLSMVKRFIEDIGGEIDVESELGEGSRFTCTMPIKIPLVDDKSTKSKGKTTATKKSRTPQKQKLKILLVEDDALAQVVASNLLKEHFFGQLDTADSGREAVQFAYKTKYNLIFMDIGLPDTNGYEVTKKIRKSGSSRNKKTVIVALTAHDSAEEKQKSVDADMNDFLTKPLNDEKIKGILQKFLPKKSQVVEELEAKTETKKSKEKATSKKAGQKIIDLEISIDRAGGNKDLALEMIKMLVEELPENLISIQTLFKGKKFEKLQKVVHKLHGGLCYCGMPRLKDATKQLEGELKSSVGDKEKISNYYNKLCNEISLVLEEYKKL